MCVNSDYIILLHTVFVGLHMNGTSDVIKAVFNGDSNVALTAAVSVGIVMGIFTTFIVAVSLVVILRRRRYLTHFCG